MSGQSVNLTTLFLGRLRPPKRLTSTSCIYFHQYLTTTLLELNLGNLCDLNIYVRLLSDINKMQINNRRAALGRQSLFKGDFFFSKTLTKSFKDGGQSLSNLDMAVQSITKNLSLVC